MRKMYEQHYKALLIIPFALLLLSIAQIAYQVHTEGDFVHRGVSLKGGITLTFPQREVQSVDQLKTHLLDALPTADVEVRRQLQGGGFVIDASDTTAEELIPAVEEFIGKISKDEYSVQQVGSSLGASFFKETFVAIALAFLFMGFAVLITFREWAPSAAVILAAFSDIVITLAIFNLLGEKLSSAGIAAFLMLIGYSVDTDILLSTRVLKRREGSVLDRVYSSMKTGLTMNFTTMAAVLVSMFVTQSEIIRQIMLILFIGLLADMINTWIQNAGILRWYLEGRQ